MISERMKKDIKAVVEKETFWACEQHGNFKSRHEGFAVAKEEFDEFEEEYDVVVSKMADLWTMIKLNAKSSEMKSLLKSTKERTELMIAEAIQFAAMLEKMERLEVESGNK